MPDSIKPSGGKDTYTRLYYVVLRRRACHFCMITFVTTAALLYVAMLDGTAALWNSLRISLWAIAGAVWASATIPMMMARRIQGQPSPSSCLTRYQAIVSILGSSQYFAASFLLSISSLLLWASYVAAASALNEQPDLKLFKSIPGRGASQLNERPIFLAASALFCGFCYAFAMVYDQRFPPKVADQPENLMISQRIWRSLPPIFTRTKRLSFSCALTFLPIYNVCRYYLIRAIVFSKYIQLTRFIKPHLVMMIKFNSIFTFTSNLRLVVLNLLMTSCWEISQAFWDVYLTQPLAISQFSDEPNRCLLDGLRAVDSRIKYRAIVEIALISWSDPPRRVSIFKDIRTQPKVFNAIVDECVGVISATHARVRSRGQTMSSGKPSSTHATTTQTIQGQSRSALVKDLPQLFNPQPPSNLFKKALFTKFLMSPSDTDSLALQAAKSSTPSSIHSSENNSYQIPEIFQSPRKSLIADKHVQLVPPPPPKQEPPALHSISRKQKIVPKAWKLARTSRLVRSLERFCALEDWLFLPSVRMEVRRTLVDHQACALAVEAVTNLVCASLTEDQYGVAQDQIPRVMECLIECLESVKAFSLEICEEYGGDGGDGGEGLADEELRDTMEEFVSPLLTRLNDATVGILDQFGPFLKEWKFSPKADAWIQARVKKA